MSLYLGNKRVCPIIYTGSGGGATVTAVNKSGSELAKGDKVWLNKEVRTGDTFYNFLKNSTNGGLNAIIDQSGMYAWANNKLYSLGNDSATELLTVSGKIYGTMPFYTSDGAIIANGSSSSKFSAFCIKSGMGLDLGDKYYYIQGSDNLFCKYKSNMIYKIDLMTGEILQTWSRDNLSFDDSGIYFKIGDNLYLRGNKYTLNDDGTISDPVQISAPSSYTYLTNDNKYLINLHSTYGLQIYKVVDDVTFELMPDSFLPEDLRGLAMYDNLVYNPNNGIFTMIKRYTNECVIGKYENDKFTKLSITIPLESFVVGSTTYPYFYGPITFSNDMSRMVLTTNSSTSGTNCAQFVVTYTSNDGYVAVPYKTYIVNQDTITGIAADDAENGDEFNVNVAGE